MLSDFKSLHWAHKLLLGTIALVFFTMIHAICNPDFSIPPIITVKHTDSNGRIKVYTGIRRVEHNRGEVILLTTDYRRISILSGTVEEMRRQ